MPKEAGEHRIPKEAFINGVCALRSVFIGLFLDE